MVLGVKSLNHLNMMHITYFTGFMKGSNMSFKVFKLCDGVLRSNFCFIKSV